MATYEDVGLPVSPGGPWIYRGLQYSHLGKAILVTLRGSPTASAARLYIRRTDEERYRELSPGPEPKQFLNAVVCEASPLAFFLVHDKPRDELAVYQASLPSVVLERLPSPSLEGSHARAWVSAMHAAAHDGASVLVTVSVQPQPAADGGYRIRFALAHMAVASGVLTIVAELPATFA